MKSYKIKNGAFDGNSIHFKRINLTDIFEVADGYSLENYSNAFKLGNHYSLEFVIKKDNGYFTTSDTVGKIKDSVINKITEESTTPNMWRYNSFCGLSKTLYSNNSIGYLYIGNSGNLIIGSGGNAEMSYSKISLII